MSIAQQAAPTEYNRIIDLLEFDLDYTELDLQFNNLVALAARVAGTEISLLNLIDAYTQWTVSGHGYPVGQTPRENSICQYTLLEPDHFEVKDLQCDERFKERDYVKEGLQLRYYYGLPLKTPKGNSIGTLCVLDTALKDLTDEKKHLLKDIANEIVSRLTLQQYIYSLRSQLTEAREAGKRVAHDIRGPLGGIMGLAELISHKGSALSMEKMQEFNRLIYTSAQSLLELADEILQAGLSQSAPAVQQANNLITLEQFREKLLQLYKPQATEKIIQFEVQANAAYKTIPFPKNKLLQIAGNLVSNAFKFTPPLGAVKVKLDFTLEPDLRILHIQVTDNGIGIAQEQLDDILSGNAYTTTGTDGEAGFGLGLQLVKHLLHSLQGTIQATSVPGSGTSFDVRIPVGTVAPILSV